MTTPASLTDRRDPLAPLTLIALVIALAAVATRCTVLELNSTILDFGPDNDVGGPGPSTTIALDLLCMLPALLVGVRRAIDPTYVLRWHVSQLLLAGVAAWVTISAIWAPNKFDALINAETWWAATSLYWAISQLCRSWLRWRPVLGVAVGLLMTFVAQAAIYKYVELPETQAYWQRTKADVMARSGRSADDFAMRRYDQLINNGQMQGFFRSPNTFAAVAVLAAFASAGLAWQRIKDKDEPVFGVVLAVPVVAVPLVIVWTGSKTAAGTAMLSTVGLLIALRLRAWLAAKSNVAYGLGVAAAIAGVIAIVAVGLTTGGLIQDSLNFRWNYWVAAYHMVLAKPLLGVGWANFGDAYLAYRLPVAAEEIKDPHNLLVRFATEAGLIGLVLAVAWLAVMLREMTRPVLPRPSGSPALPWNPLKTLLATAVAFWLLRTIVLFPLSVTRLEAIKTALFAVLLLGGLLIATVRKTSGQFVADDRPAHFSIYALIAGLLGFLLHNQFDFPICETGPLFLFMLLGGALLGLRHPGVAGRKTHTAIALGGLAIAGLGLIAVIGLWAVPVWSAEAKIAEANLAGANSRTADALRLSREAIAASPVPNPEYPRNALRWTQTAQPRDVVALMGQVIEATPQNAQAWLNRARVESDPRFGVPVETTMTDYLKAIQLNPNDATFHLNFAHYLDSIGNSDEAAKQIRAALDANDKLNPDEPRRLPPEQVEHLKKRVSKPN